MNKKTQSSESSIFDKNDGVFSYTSKQAEQDGILFDITQINSTWKKGLFNYITTNLLHKGKYLEHDKFSIHNLLDLLNQALHIVKTKSKNFTEFDYFFVGKIELPNGQQQEIYISRNETGKYTIMLPEDY